MEPCIVIHGGCRKIPDEYQESIRTGVKLAARKGYEVLLEGGSAVDAVEAAVRNMEDNSIFNAGHGCALTEENTAELDAFIMDGHNLATGAVACVQAIANPVSLARRVMEDTPHCLLAAEGALKFARKIGFPVLENPLDLVTTESHERSAGGPDYIVMADNYLSTGDVDDRQGFDTVGALALDSHGRLASATSTGGIPMKMPGRVGDTPLVGCGGYANNVAAASTTGHGESLMKTVLAWDVVRNVEDGLSPAVACEKCVNKMATSIQGVGGVIALNSKGEFGKAFCTNHIAWASVSRRVVKFGLGDPADEQEVPF